MRIIEIERNDIFVNIRIKNKRLKCLATHKRVTYNRAKTLTKWAKQVDRKVFGSSDDSAQYVYDEFKMITKSSNKNSSYIVIPCVTNHKYIIPSVFSTRIRPYPTPLIHGTVTLCVSELKKNAIKNSSRYAIILGLEAFQYAESMVLVDTFYKTINFIEVSAAFKCYINTYEDNEITLATPTLIDHLSVLYPSVLNDFEFDITSHSTCMDSLYTMVGILGHDVCYQHPALKLIMENIE